MLVNSRDITERERAQHELRQSESKFRGIFEGSLDAIVIFSAADGRALEVNQAFSRIYGYRPDEVIGTTAREFGFWSNRDDLERFLKGLSDRGEVRGLETSLRAKDGTTIPSAITAVRLGQDSEPFVLSVIRDITAQKNTEAELARTRDAALEVSRLKSAFLANTSHEIRTPLNVILGYSDLIADHFSEQDDHTHDAYLEGIKRAGTRLLRVIELVLDYSKIESGAFEVKPTPIRLGGLIEGLIADLKVLAAAKRIEVRATLGEPDITLMFDEHCLTSALANLIQNAIKFTPKGTVTVALRRDRSKHLRLDIRDTGIGIDKAYLPRLFEPFSQEESSDNRRFEGWGLGLALAKRYLELNGANLSVSSKKGVGSTFTIRFASASEVRLPSLPAARTQRTIHPAQRENRPRLLLVEDDPDTQAFMQALLSGFYEVKLAASGDEMRRQLLERVPDIILMDLSLKGGEDGLALVCYLGGHARWRLIPVIAVTGYTSAEDRARAAAAGCAAYVPKPIQRDELLGAIEAVLKSTARTAAKRLATVPQKAQEMFAARRHLGV